MVCLPMSVPAPVPVPVLLFVFVYPAQGPGGETSMEARKGHYAHATYRSVKIGSGRCLLRQGTSSSAGAGSECGDDFCIYYHFVCARNR